MPARPVQAAGGNPVEFDTVLRPMQPPTRALVATWIVLAALVAACQTTTNPSLGGRTFLSAAITENGAPRQLVPGTRIQLDFKEGGVSANAGCNQMSGLVRFENGRLLVRELSSTAMGCDAGRADQDTWLMQLLGSRPGVRLDGDELTIDSGSVVVRLVDERVIEPDLALTGPKWQVDSILANETASSVPQGLLSLIVFHEDGTVDVNAGCNTGGGTWHASGGNLEVSALAMTKKACDGPAAILESAVLEVLGSNSLVATIRGNQLLLVGGAHGLQLRAT